VVGVVVVVVVVVVVDVRCVVRPGQAASVADIHSVSRPRLDSVASDVGGKHSLCLALYL
jgi:hypothetical protein